MTYRKIGGIHWLRIGPYRFAFCRAKPKRKPIDMLPLLFPTGEALSRNPSLSRELVPTLPRRKHWVDRLPGDTLDWAMFSVLGLALGLALLLV